MTNLIQKLLGKKGEDNVRVIFKVDEIRPFFEMLGINIEKIGFPEFEKRKEINPLEKYVVNFSDVKATPILREEKVHIVVRGTYTIQSKVSYKDSSGIWRPGIPQEYSFRIEDGKLNLE